MEKDSITFDAEPLISLAILLDSNKVTHKGYKIGSNATFEDLSLTLTILDCLKSELLEKARELIDEESSKA